MPSITELLANERTKGFVEVAQRLDSVKNYYNQNAIGEEVVVKWDAFKQKDKFPYAMEIAKQYDEMIEKTIPKDMILSARFESWIKKERNELISENKLNSDAYFKSWTDFNTGEVFTRNQNEIIEAKGNYLDKELNRLQKSFVTHMQKSPDLAFANEETLQKWANYYDKRQEEIRSHLKQGDFSSYDKKNQIGTEQDAVNHLNNIKNRMAMVENALNEKKQDNQQTSNSNKYVDYVGNKVPFKNH